MTVKQATIFLALFAAWIFLAACAPRNRPGPLAAAPEIKGVTLVTPKDLTMMGKAVFKRITEIEGPDEYFNLAIYGEPALAGRVPADYDQLSVERRVRFMLENGGGAFAAVHMVRPGLTPEGFAELGRNMSREAGPEAVVIERRYILRTDVQAGLIKSLIPYQDHLIILAYSVKRPDKTGISKHQPAMRAWTESFVAANPN